MVMILDPTTNTAALTGANVVCAFDVRRENEADNSVLAVYKPHPDAEYRYTAHIFSVGEMPSDRDYGVNEADGYCLATLLVNLQEKYGDGAPWLSRDRVGTL